MDIKEMDREDVDFTHLAQENPVAGSCDHSNEPSGIRGEG
jgi:hypothetical protein